MLAHTMEPEPDWRRLDSGGGIQRGAPIQVYFNGRPLRAYTGETIAAVLLAYGQRSMRTSVRFAEPRGLLCGMGTCYECVLVVDERPNVRACMTLARPDMRIETQHGPFAGVDPVPRWP
jgi:2Fe-2S iron-sulfur cluster binding domain